MATWRAAIAAFATMVITPVAYAGNDDSILLGNDAALTGGAVVSTVNDGSALWYNPSGLARAKNDSVDVGASAFALRKYNIPAAIAADDGTRADASFTEIVTIPSALTFVRRMNERTVVGLGLFASQLYDFTLRSSFEVTDPSADLRFRIQTVGSAEIARYHLAGGVGVALARGLTLGVALVGDYADSAQSQRISSDAAVTGMAFASAVNSALVQQKVLGFHLRAGLGYRPVEGLSLGLSVESPGFYFYRNQRVTQFANFTNLAADGGPTLDSAFEDVTTKSVSLGLYAPVRVRLGAALQFGRVTLALEGDMQPKLEDKTLDVKREFVWNLRAGGQVTINEHVRLGAGLFTDRSADAKDEVGAGKVHFYGGTLGGEYQNQRWLESSPGETKRAALTFSSTVALRYAYGTGKFAGTYVPLSNFEIQDAATEIDVHELTLHIGSGLYF